MDEVHFKSREGTTLCGRYTLVRLIGVGGMGAVYRGSHRNGNPVAVKVLHSTLAASDDVRARFLREGYLANTVQHRGVVRVLDDDVTEDGTAFLVMDLLTGETLATRLERDAVLPTHEAVGIMCALLEVLVAAHQADIVHRDLKPENIFLEREGGLKILDFGIAKVAGVESTTRTGRGAMGTPFYMSPEHARGQMKLVDAQSDVWSVGANLFRCLTGREVYEGESPELVMIHAATEPPPRIEVVRPTLDPELCEVVNRALSATKEGRWPSAAAMLAELERVRAALEADVAIARLERSPLGLWPDEAATIRDHVVHDPEDAVVRPTLEPPEATAPDVVVDLASVRPKAHGVRPFSPSEVPPSLASPEVEPSFAPPSFAHPASARETAASEDTIRVTRDVTVSAPGWPSPRRTGVFLAAGLGVAVVLVLLVKGGASFESAAGAPPVVEPLAPPVLPASEVPPSLAAALPETAIPVASAEIPASTLLSVPTEGVPKRPHRAPAATSPKSASPRAGAPRRPDCNPNYVLDAQGFKHFKKECF